jgi:hypothetical protein
MQDVRENFRNYRNSPAYAHGRNGVNEVGNTLVSVLKILGTILLVILGIPFLIVGIVALITLFAVLFASHTVLGLLPFNHGINFMDFLHVPGASITWMTIGIMLVIGIPLVMLIYAGIKMIFRIKSSNHIFGSAFAGLFIVGILILLFSGSRTLGQFSKQSTVSHHEQIKSTSDTLYLTAKQGISDADLDQLVDPDFNFENFRIGTLNGQDVMIGLPKLKIEKCDNNDFDFVVNKTSRGLNISNAKQNADEINYNYMIKDSLINIPKAYLLPKGWRNQRVNVKICIPVGKTVYLDESLKTILSDVRNTTDTYDEEMVNKYWTMKPDGLTLVNRAVPNVKPAKK